ncbi:MAG: Multidrug resistance protein MdtA [Phycisphaerae bacterium]|nr:Multidrug resistance protein MdtA [Phycisphaerae bacterium]
MVLAAQVMRPAIRSLSTEAGFGVAVNGIGLLSVIGWCTLTADSTRLPALTLPARTVTLAAAQPGRIARIEAREGAFVRAGDTLVALDDRVQEVRTAMVRAEAESDLDVRLARIRLQRSRDELERFEELARTQTASATELLNARAGAAAAAVELEQAQFKQSQAGVNLELQSRLLEQFRMRAPFDGYVSERMKEVGETVEGPEPILVLVQLDPLEVQVDCPIELATRVASGQELLVTPELPAWPPRRATVVFVSRVADPGSQTLRMRLAIANADQGWISGMKVFVEIPVERTAAAAADGAGVRAGQAAIAKAGN